ncbi:MAG: DUF814 domain-containing protein [Candidatus Diapherotrites archaeon]|nr:DUF814 domain-containing protein [Candidatus Diapherotrites archaeon]
MKVVLRFDETVHENAKEHFEKSKKARKKLAGLKKAIFEMEKKIGQAKAKKEQALKVKEIKKKREKKWFEKFHWFYSSDSFLIIAGRDAKSNEVLVKKHMETNDIYFHADIFGAPHTVIKTGGKVPAHTTLNEAAQFAAIFSRAWKQKLAAVDVYSVKPEQVSKSAPTGEALGTGAFMVYGKRNWFKKTPLEFAIGVNSEGRIISGPKTAVEKNSETLLEIGQGEESSGAAAKKINKVFEHKTGKKIDLDEIISMLPAGGVKVNK